MLPAPDVPISISADAADDGTGVSNGITHHTAPAVIASVEDSASLPDGPLFWHNGASYELNQVRKLCKGMSVLYLYSGPRRPGDFASACDKFGAEASLVDTELDEPLMDLLDEAIFDIYMKAIANKKYQAVMMSMPCSSFSSSRSFDDGGPRPLRGISPTDIYGLPDLTLADKETVRAGTILALRGAAMARLCVEIGVPWLAETPIAKEGQPSILLLPEWIAVNSLDGVRSTNIVQCGFGAPYRKGTTLWGTVGMDGLPTECNHEYSMWKVPWSGQAYWSPHAWLRGTQSAIPACDWNPTMLRPQPPCGPYVSRAAAMYPEAMNLDLAGRLLLAAGIKQQATLVDSHFVRAGAWSNSLIRVLGPGPSSLKRPLLLSQPRDFNIKVSRVNHARARPLLEPPTSHVGDLRNISSSVQSIPGHLVIGNEVCKALENFLDANPAVEDSCIRSIGKESNQDQVIDEATLIDLRHTLGGIFESHGAILADNYHLPCKSDDISSSVCGSLLHAWASAAGDPAAPIANWFRDGAPAGIKIPFDELKGIMPDVTDSAIADDPDDLGTDYDTFTNHGDLEDDPEVVATFKEFVDKGYLKSCSTLEECREFLNGELPILNKFACILKYKWDDESSEWKVKRRIIMDSLRSGVKDASTRKFKSVLPRVTDAVSALLAALDDCKHMTGVSAEQFVIDATDAFWEVGLHPDERRFFVGKLGDQFLIYLRTAQGSRGAPVSWAAAFGLICRCVQSLFFVSSSSRRSKFDVDLQVYVDDPWAVVIGTEKQRNRRMALMILVWRIIGVRLAFAKARRGLQVDWIGSDLCLQDESFVKASIMENRMSEVKFLTASYLTKNIISIKELRSFTGKIQSMASLLHTWRPFVVMLWAAMSKFMQTNVISKSSLVKCPMRRLFRL